MTLSEALMMAGCLVVAWIVGGWLDEVKAENEKINQERDE